jgi:hypothetical protein
VTRSHTLCYLEQITALYRLILRYQSSGQDWWDRNSCVESLTIVFYELFFAVSFRPERRDRSSGLAQSGEIPFISDMEHPYSA